MKVEDEVVKECSNCGNDKKDWKGFHPEKIPCSSCYQKDKWIPEPVEDEASCEGE